MPNRDSWLMEFRQLRYFVAVAEALNFTRAAERLRVAQPALSRQIQNLENELGARLLERDSRRVSLTRAGSLLLEDAREIMDLVEAAEARVRRSEALPQITYRIGYAPTLTAPWMPKILASVRRHAPGAQIQLFDLSNQEMVEKIRDGSIDVGLLPDHAIPRSGVYLVQSLGEIDFEVALPRGHALAQKKALKLRDLGPENLIIYNRKEYPEYYNSLHAIFAAAGEPLVPGVEVNSGESLVTSVRESQGIAIVATTVRHSQPDGLDFRPLDPKPIGFLLCLASHRDAPLRSIEPLRRGIQAGFDPSAERS